MKRRGMKLRSIAEVMLTVTEYKDGNLTGWLEHTHGCTPVEVKSLPHLLFQIEEHLKDDSAIQSSVFETEKPPGSQLTTLRIQILFQEHYTWQGCILREGRRLNVPFRSVWELIQILDELLAEEETIV